MRRVDRAFQHLRPVARRVHLDDCVLDAGLGRPGRRLELAHLLFRSKPRPHEAAGFAHRIRPLLERAFERRTIGLRGHLEDVALDVEFPAVIQAAQAAFLIAAEGERRAAMRAVLVEHAELAVAVAEDDQVFAHEPRLHRRAVLLRDFLRQADRQPVAAHDAAHRRRAFDAAEELVLVLGQHAGPDKCAAKIYLGT